VDASGEAGPAVVFWKSLSAHDASFHVYPDTGRWADYILHRDLRLFRWVLKSGQRDAIPLYAIDNSSLRVARAINGGAGTAASIRTAKQVEPAAVNVIDPPTPVDAN
jgi:hypothetical protein